MDQILMERGKTNTRVGYTALVVSGMDKSERDSTLDWHVRV